MNWALKRQLLYLAILVGILLFFGFIFVFPYFNKTPTCTDGRQDGTETGVDCGGSCALACTSQTDKISLVWARSFEVVPGRYNALAYLQNSNKNAAIQKINYRFRFADKDNVYIGKREGTAYVPPSSKFVIFEPAISLGNGVPVYTSFEFTSDPVWIQIPQDRIDQLKVLVSNINLQNEDTSPALSATVTNTSLFQISGLDIVAILYDATGNAVSASRTYLDNLSAEQSSDINFTWVEPFSAKVISKEIIPIVNVFTAKLQ